MKRRFVSLAFGQACRYCHNISFMSDRDGPVHPCCIIWFEREKAGFCVACRASEKMRHQRERR